MHQNYISLEQMEGEKGFEQKWTTIRKQKIDTKKDLKNSAHQHSHPHLDQKLQHRPEAAEIPTDSRHVPVLVEHLQVDFMLESTNFWRPLQHFNDKFTTHRQTHILTSLPFESAIALNVDHHLRVDWITIKDRQAIPPDEATHVPGVDTKFSSDVLPDGRLAVSELEQSEQQKQLAYKFRPLQN